MSSTVVALLYAEFRAREIHRQHMRTELTTPTLYVWQMFSFPICREMHIACILRIFFFSDSNSTLNFSLPAFLCIYFLQLKYHFVSLPKTSEKKRK